MESVVANAEDRVSHWVRGLRRDFWVMDVTVLRSLRVDLMMFLGV